MVSLYTATNRGGSRSAEGEAESERAEDGNGTATRVSSALLIRPSGQEKVDVHIIRSRRLLGKNRWEEGLGSLAGLVGCDRRSRLLFNSGVRRCLRPSRSWHQMAPSNGMTITRYPLPTHSFHWLLESTAKKRVGRAQTRVCISETEKVDPAQVSLRRARDGRVSSHGGRPDLTIVGCISRFPLWYM